MQWLVSTFIVVELRMSLRMSTPRKCRLTGCDNMTALWRRTLSGDQDGLCLSSVTLAGTMSHYTHLDMQNTSCNAATYAGLPVVPIGLHCGAGV